MNSSNFKLNVEVSAVKYHRPLWRYVILFQSWSQFRSWLGMFALACLTVCAFLLIMGQPVKSFEVIRISVAIGSLVAVVMTLPAQFTVRTSEATPFRAIVNELKNMHYHEQLHSENNVVYHQELPRLMRWNEGDVLIQSEANVATITGPTFILTILRDRLLHQYA
ncbi:hypothetical protein LP420_31300 [Massilia sp. B-10]|nr:hypothetical protein LP420_31300 [Massilia sp. B-10]